MNRAIRLIFLVCCLWQAPPSYGEGRPADRFEPSTIGENIETRDQLLSMVNRWLKEHHQPPWSEDELIGRSFDQAFIVYFVYNDSPLDLPVESFLVSLIKNQPFKHEIRLRSDRRDEITLHTARGEITRQRHEWEKVRKNQQSWSDMTSKTSDTPRRLPLPEHYTLTLDILSLPEENGRDDSPDKLTRSSIFLASALAGRETPTKVPKSMNHGSSTLAATPAQLLDGVNKWKRSFNQRQAIPPEITARVADEIFNLREVGGDFWEIDLELLLECLAKNAPFIYPISIDAEKPGYAEEPDSFRMLSINEELPLPPRHTVGINISSLPYDLKAEDPPPRLDWRRIIFSYSFPKGEIMGKTKLNREAK